MHRRKLALFAALSVASAFVACTLNPQPLPPSELSPGADASRGTADAGSFNGNEDPLVPAADAGAPVPMDGDGGDGGSDGGDGGSDGGDAGADADAG